MIGGDIFGMSFVQSVLDIVAILCFMYLAYRGGLRKGISREKEAYEELFKKTNDLVLFVENGKGISPNAFLKAKEIRKAFPEMETGEQRFLRNKQEAKDMDLP